MELSKTMRELPPGVHRPKLARDVTEAVGRVPFVRLNRMGEVCERHDLFVKLESCNPGGSIKEKNAVYLIREAEESGKLAPGGTIVESSSGNFGLGLAMVGATKGYRVIIVVDKNLSPLTGRMMQAYGAELHVVTQQEADAQGGSFQRARMIKARELSAGIPGAFYPAQHTNPLNPMAHMLYTAQEIEAAFDGPPDVIVVGISTSGTLTGISNYFRRRYAGVRFVGIDIAGSVVLGLPAFPYQLPGLGLNFMPPNYDPQVLDSAYSITESMAYSVCHELARREGLLLGASTGCNVAGGLAFAELLEGRQKIAIISHDSGDRYLETVYNPEWLAAHGHELLRGEALDQAIRDLEPVSRPTFLKAGKA